MSLSPRPPCSQACPGGRRLEVRGVAAEARLHCEPVPGRRAALPDQTLIGFDTASRRREEAFLLLFFFPSFMSKREPFFFFCMKGPSSALLSPPTPPWCCCAPRFSLSLLSIRSYIDSFLRLKPADVCFFCLPLLSSLSLGC